MLPGNITPLSPPYLLNLLFLAMFPVSKPALKYIPIPPCTLPPLPYSCSEVINLILNLSMLPGTLPGRILSSLLFSPPSRCKPVLPGNASYTISPLSPTEFIAVYAPMIYTAPCVMPLMRAAFSTWASGRGLGSGNQEFFGSCEMASSR
jgi:hypothetical protein